MPTPTRSTPLRVSLLLLLVGIAAIGPGCGDDQAHDEAVALLEVVRGANYNAWASPDGFAEKTPSHTLHKADVRVYFDSETAPHHVGDAECAAYLEANPSAQGTYFTVTNAAGHTEWPNGSTFVKEGFDGGGDLGIIAIMEKRAGEWFFAEYDGDGEVLFSGEPELCIDCHAGADDFIFTGRLSRLCRP